MNKEYKEKWIAALRSGKYKQGKGVLRNSNNEFCCLGVLCDIVLKDNPDIGSWKNTSDNCYYFSTGIVDYDYTYLPQVISDITGINRRGEFSENSAPLTTYNDSYGITFNQIADIIERKISDEYRQKLQTSLRKISREYNHD